jgi:hypothetical protein
MIWIVLIAMVYVGAPIWAYLMVAAFCLCCGRSQAEGRFDAETKAYFRKLDKERETLSFARNGLKLFWPVSRPERIWTGLNGLRARSLWNNRNRFLIG